MRLHHSSLSLYLFLSLMLFNCNGSQDELIIKQSIEAHESGLEAGEKVSNKIQRIEEALSGTDELSGMNIQDSLTALKRDLESWKAMIVEVPGHEHSHEGHEEHDHHHHEPEVHLTPEMVLEVQLDMKVRAEKLDKRADLLLEKIKSK